MYALEMSSIKKSFPGVRALNGVSMKIKPGEIRGLAGENGAGKSTLIKILSGAHKADAGEIVFFNEQITDPSPEAMIERGIAVIYQELIQAEHLTVGENIFLGCLPRRAFGLVDWAKVNRDAGAVMRSLGFDIDPREKVSDLSVARRQMVEIAKAVARNAKLVVLDEPSAVLGDSELESLFQLIRHVSREKGVSFIYITHRLKEFFDICDSVSILRDGTLIDTQDIANIDAQTIIRQMVGREVNDMFPKRNRKIGKVALSVQGISRGNAIRDISLEVRSGEILGICGLAGSGRSEILHAIMGADPLDAGSMTLYDKPFRPRSTQEALGRGVGLLPEDRKVQGAFLNQSVAFNVTVGCERKMAERLFRSPAREADVTSQYIRQLRIKTSDTATAIGTLSGGNQQKCLIARQMNAGCSVFLIDEPTRGVDVGAKREIYQELAALADESGAALIVVSSDLLEIMGICDRIAVMREGQITATLPAAGATEETIMQHATFH